MSRLLADQYTATARRLIGTDRGNPKLHAAMSLLSDAQEMIPIDETHDYINAAKKLLCDMIDEQRLTVAERRIANAR